MKHMVQIWKTNDLRWLLDVEVLPENYDTDYLIPVLDKIIFEDEELTGNKYYTNFLRKSDFGNKDAAKLVALRWSYEILLCDPSKDKEVEQSLLKLKVKANSIDTIDFQMKRLTQQLQVRAMKEAGKEKEALSFGSMCAQISDRLENVSIKEVRDSTVSEYRGYQDIIKAKAA